MEESTNCTATDSPVSYNENSPKSRYPQVNLPAQAWLNAWNPFCQQPPIRSVRRNIHCRSASRLHADCLFNPSSPKHQVVLVNCNYLSRRDGHLG